ncbi:MAG: hypothetical protein EXR78_10030 [Deltaproteobacteria bacterium]|nr:hypothetical protein [Deltaproteobacteria bacterium]
MNFVLQPWQLLLSIVAGWIHDEQQKIIEYQRTIRLHARQHDPQLLLRRPLASLAHVFSPQGFHFHYTRKRRSATLDCMPFGLKHYT